MAFTGASSDPAEIGAYGDELVQDLSLIHIFLSFSVILNSFIGAIALHPLENKKLNSL